MKKTLLFVSLIAVLVLNACTAPAAVPAAPSSGSAVQQAPVQQNGQPQLRTISVNGVGQVTLSPDIAYIYIGVFSQAENVSDALTQNNAKAQAVSGALQELGVDPKDIQTSGFSINPQQKFDEQGQPAGIEYSVNNTVYVTVRKLQILGQLLDVVVRSGANNITGVTFDVSDKSQGISNARQLAIDSARSQAEEIAQVAGVTLGELQTMNVFSSSPPVPVFEGKGGMASDASSVPVSAGQILLRVEVSAVYTIR